MTAPQLELILFASTYEWVHRAMSAGICSFIVDWEHRGKRERQRGAETEVEPDTADDLCRLQEYSVPRRFCRVNPYGPWTSTEVNRAINAGATDLFLPMVKERSEVIATRRHIAGQCRLGILIETEEALNNLVEIAREQIDFVYVGLNDLAISRGSRSIFQSLVDGTVERVREVFADVPFGCAGVTAVDCGWPVPARLILAELARLACTFSFARRSFRRDMADRDLTFEMKRIQSTWTELSCRSSAEIQADHAQLSEAISQIYASCVTRAVS
jgi:HpcH/HpaI aldolase/citrate lyase family